MRLRLTLVTGSRLDLEVSCAEGTRWGDLRADLARSGLLHVGVAERWHIVGRALADEAVVGRPPVLDGAVISSSPLGVADAPSFAGPLHLHVTSGPDAGLIFPLGTGRYRLGRAAEATLRVHDPDLSRLHLEVVVDTTAATVCDLATTNGSWLTGRRLGVEASPWRIGERLRVGSSVLELRTHGSRSAATIFDGIGHELVNRAPRLSPSVPAVEIRQPSPLEPRSASRFPALTMALPLLLALPLAWMQHSATYLLFGLMSPAMMLGNFVTERRGGRRDERVRMATWQRESAEMRRAVAAAVSAEGEQRRAGQPDPAELLLTAEGRLARIWERRLADADALVVRVGLGEVRSRVRVVAADGTDSEPPTLGDVPVGVSLRQVGVVGIAGLRPLVVGLARSLVAQVAGWHSPSEVSLVILAEDDQSCGYWLWATLLPHSRPENAVTCASWIGSLDRGDQVRRQVAELEQTLAERLATGVTSGAAWAGPCVVVLIDGARRLRSVPGVADLLERGPAVGIYAICLTEAPSELPIECRAYVEVAPTASTGSASATVCVGDEPPRVVVPDCVAPRWAERFAHAVAPLRDSTPVTGSRGLPESCRLLDLLGNKAIQPSTLADSWSIVPRSTNVVLGVGEDGPCRLDLARDGPHILVGGTTGAGKSELLQTLIASLAVANSPTQLTFVLVDYKGGSAFDRCAGLPHTLGLVTDLDPHLAERALTSLTAELKRREVMLRAVGAKDIDDYVAQVGPAGPDLPRLVLVVDEFRMIAEELPTFLEGMVRIAALGRSLGVHLVLATQRPAGIVSGDIAANVNLRIALRVRDQVDSLDVIEAPDAAAISPHSPGRAFARAGSQALVPFQTARVAGSTRPASSGGCQVRVLTAANIGQPAIASVADQDLAGSTDLAQIVDAAGQAARLLRLPAARRPWLPPLPEVVTLDELDDRVGPWRAPYAVVDRPQDQAQRTLAWDLVADGHLAVVGTMRTGRSTLMRTLAGSLANRLTPDEVHLHAIDGGAGAMRALARLPHVGVVAGSADVHRGVRLLDRLAQEVARRREIFGRDGFASLAEHRESVELQQQLPYLVLMIDGWEAVSGAWESIEHGRPIEVLQQLMRDGPGIGLQVVVSGDRSLLTSRMASLLSDKLILRLADPVDLALAGIPAAAVPGHQPAGRCLRSVDQVVIQIALLDPDPSGPAQVAALDRIAAGASTPRLGTGPIRIEPLPSQVLVADLARAVGGSPPGWALVGAGGDAGDPVGLSLRGTSALIAGPARSGRTTALRTMSAWLGEHGQDVILVTPGPSSLAELAGRAGIAGVVQSPDVQRLSELLARHPDCCVVVDDVERLLDTEAEDVVTQWFKSADRVAGSLLVAGNASDLSSMFRGLSVLARRSGQGILLQPTTYADGDLLGVRIPTTGIGERIPGRGILVRDGSAEPVQVTFSD